jgi:hypothetical protein
MKEKSFSIIMKLKEIVESLDKLIFRDCSISVKIVEKAPALLIAYVPQSNNQEECYVVGKWSDQEILQGLRCKGKVFDIDNLLLEVAAHEVRHRVQCKFKLNLFEEFPFVEIKDPALKFAIEKTRKYFKKVDIEGIFLHTTERREAKEEFDAMVVAKYASIKWKGDNYEEIANIIRHLDFKKLWGDSPQFLLIYPFMKFVRSPNILGYSVSSFIILNYGQS